MTGPILQNATPHQLELAAALNHKELFSLEAFTLGGKTLQSGGLTWTSGTIDSGSMIAFPDMTGEESGDRLDELIVSYLLNPPHGAGCWSLDPPRPADIGVRLLARGFQPGWRPRWMALDLRQLQAHHPSPPGLKIVMDNHNSLQRVKNLPYATVVIPAASSLKMPGQWAHFVAYLRGKVVGHAVVFLATEESGAAGIYHVGVIPSERRKGIGKAVTLAACLHAFNKGYRYAVLNSTDAGRRTYEQLGFETVGEGWTWWLMMDRFLKSPPIREEVVLAEAIGRGDMAALADLRPFRGQLDLNRPLTNGMTFMQLAVHCHQPEAGLWLLEGGAGLSVLEAWDLGWKERAQGLLQKDPGEVNRLYSEWDKTLLHFAAERNDMELARLALSARPDLRLKDKTYQGTSLDWAKYFGHPEIARLILEKEVF